MKTILVIEDDRMFLTLTVKLLERQGYSVIAARDGLAGITRARERTPDLILCDLMIPSIDGFEVVEMLRKDPATASVPIIIMTALSDRKSIRIGMELGADDYLTKPVTAEELLGAVKTCFEKQTRFEKTSQQRLDGMRMRLAMSLPDDIYPSLRRIIDLSGALAEGSEQQPDQSVQIAKSINRVAWRLWHMFKDYLVDVEIEFTKTNQPLDHVGSVKALIEQQAHEAAHQVERSGDLSLTITDTELLDIPNTYMERIIRELIDNAFKFSAKGTPITVQAAMGPKGYQVDVTDRGRGMTPSQIAEIGIFSARRSNDEPESRGLGLMIVKHLADLCGATLDIDSQANKQTRISVSFPTSTPEAPVDQSVAQSTS